MKRISRFAAIVLAVAFGFSGAAFAAENVPSQQANTATGFTVTDTAKRAAAIEKIVEKLNQLHDANKKPTAPAEEAKVQTPTGLTAKNAEGVVNLEWQPVAGAHGYNVYRDGVYLGSASTPYAEDSSENLVKGQKYSYQVQAYNELGELSAKSKETKVVFGGRTWKQECALRLFRIIKYFFSKFHE